MIALGSDPNAFYRGMPLRPRFDIYVGVYLNNSPTPLQKACIQQFFDDLWSGPVNNKYACISKNLYLVYACDHIITISVKPNGAALVLSIQPE